ncbi:hypothetical protein [Nonomuraea basaltis]|uniref:hypothetical protein n=1 Tax=Nonomuraea basaltis TaxID=2495887 RepID=UPI00110C47D9|nr:hypothetical protein [Nonomuraea basaltis]TMR90544.1 hypothetical protein EJK15_54865 [Nonomuraea basaltis]
MTRHVIQMSGGIGSFCAAERVRVRYGAENMVLLFADTKVEDPTLYQFLHAAAAYLKAPLVTVEDGRTPFEVFRDVRWIGNSRVAPCTKHLKQKPCRAWLEEHCDPADTILYVGIDHSESHRTPPITAGWAPWRVEFPMCEEPHLTREEMFDRCRAADIELPRLYSLGFKHNNCGGCCVRAGKKQWLRTLQEFPERYAEAERQEEELRAELGDVSILREQRNGQRYNLSLGEQRRRHEADAAARPALLSEREVTRA